MKTITLKNDFHRTECRVRVADIGQSLTKSQLYRVQKSLCGVAECRCGGLSFNQRQIEATVETDFNHYGQFDTFFVTPK